MQLDLVLLPQTLAVSRLASSSAIPPWARGGFVSISRTADELSIVCDDDATPAGTTSDRGWRALKVAGPISFDVVGVAAALVVPLANAGISVLPIATYETDYLLVKATLVDRAIGLLESAGHCVTRG